MSDEKILNAIPADVPEQYRAEFLANYNAITRGTGRLLLFSVDQKIEHLNYSFYGPDIVPQDNSPQHLFEIAAQGNIGAMATQLGLIARYAQQFAGINYIVKLNSKTPLVSTEIRDPLSETLWTVEQVTAFKQQTKLPVCGIGYTVYLGSKYEHQMLAQAAQAVYQAHQVGFLAIMWMYPRGQCVTDERDGMLIAGAAGVANALGADFAKINAPEGSHGKTSEQWLAIAQEAAGNTKLICSGGKTVKQTAFLERLHKQLVEAHIAGIAVGRNIHQRSREDAVAFTNKLALLIY